MNELEIHLSIFKVIKSANIYIFKKPYIDWITHYWWIQKKRLRLRLKKLFSVKPRK